MKIAYIIIFTTTIFISQLCAQDTALNIETQNYIKKYASLAMLEQRQFQIPASITLAQGILESGNGQSYLAVMGFNHFGIKCGSNWSGPTLLKDDDSKNECFRSYESAEGSFADHSLFLKNNKRYAFLFELDLKDYTSWAYGLKKAGYATNPLYAEKLINYIETYNLNQYTILAQSALLPNEIEEVVDKPIFVVPIGEQNVIPPVMIYRLDSSFQHMGLKATYVPKGQSLIPVAKHWNIKLTKLLKFNDLNTDITPANSIIFLESKRPKGLNSNVLMPMNASLWEVSQQEATQIKTIAKLNGIQPTDLPVAGQLIFLIERNPNSPISIDNARIINKGNGYELIPTEMPDESKVNEDNLPFRRVIKLKNTPSNTQSNTGNAIIVESNTVPQKTEIKRHIEVNTQLDSAFSRTNEPIQDVKIVEIEEQVSADDNVEEPSQEADNMIHVVDRGQTLGALAMLYMVDKQTLMKVNNLSSETLTPGQQLIIPPSEISQKTKLPPPPPPPMPARIKDEQSATVSPPTATQKTNIAPSLNNVSKTHTVVPGETLFRIAVENNTSVQDIKDANQLSTNEIAVGQKLIIPPYSGKYPLPTENTNTKISPSTPSKTNSPSITKTQIHTVKSGENLYRISLQYGVTMSDIIKWNNLSNENVVVGQKLKIIK